MHKIAFLVPHAPMVPIIKKVIAPYKGVQVAYCANYDRVLTFADHLVETGCEIIIARAGTASRLKSSNIKATIIEIPVTAFDIIRAVTTAKAYGANIAVVAYSSMVQGIECLTPLLGFALHYYLTERNDADIDHLIRQAAADGADVIVGGGIFCKVAKKHGLPAVFIDNGQEAILHAVQEALRIEGAIEAEKLKRSLFTAVLDYVHDGIITVDCQQKITSINMRAQQICNTSASKALDQPIGEIWPGLSLAELISTQQEEINKLAQIRGLKVLYNKVPIVVSGKLSGALVTFREITKIQQAEAHIRREIYNKGHIAKKTFADVLGISSTIRRSIALAREFAATNSNILITGETGTGKEVFAQSIHNYSERQSGPFVAINCAALPAQILESELFGYVGGAFTGANKEGKPGLFELAHGGTIFLDEIAEMDYTNQSRLLRVLQERSVMRLGSDRMISVDIRVIAATNKDLKELVLANKFREDLFFRLNVLKLELPPLRERTEDIPGMAEAFLKNHMPSERSLHFDTSAVKALQNHPWPGNVRELQNTIERLLAFCQTSAIHAADVTAVLEKWQVPSVKTSFHEEEIQEILTALHRTKGNQSAAAKLLGVDRTTLWRKMRRLGIHI